MATDERIRRLERQAAAGDGRAEAHRRREIVRAGRPLTDPRLDALLELMSTTREDGEDGGEPEWAPTDAWLAAGLPVRHGEPDWVLLPSYGGEEPHDTAGVWSWDETRLIVGTCADDVRIVDREEA